MKNSSRLRPLQRITPAKVSPKRILKSADLATQPVPDEQAIPLRVGLRKRAAGKRSF